MGLFFKKKDVPTPLSLDSPERIDFDSPDFHDIPAPPKATPLFVEAPPAPMHAPLPPEPLVAPQAPPVEPVAPPAEPLPEPVSDPVPVQQPEPVKENFQLPDFDEKEINEISNISAEPAQPVAPSATKQILMDIDKHLRESPKIEEKVERIQTPKIERQVEDTKLLDIRKCFSIKDGLADLKASVKTAEDTLDQYSMQDVNHKYGEITGELNHIQERLILIDNKLF